MYYKAVITKTVWNWHKNRHIDQWKRIESPGISPNLYNQIIFNKVSRSIKWNKNNLFNKWLGDLDSYVQKYETRSPTYAIHKNKLKMDKTLIYKSQHYKSPRG